MVSLGDNLLKLTGFPFTYSFISLFALIIYGEGLYSQPIERLGPLLILMGFAATTLSIVDPIGHAQRSHLLGWISLRPRPKLVLKCWNLDFCDIEKNIQEMQGFEGYYVESQIHVWVLVCLLEMFYFKDSDDKKKKDAKEDQDVFEYICNKYKEKCKGSEDVFERVCKKYKDKCKEISDKMSAKEVLGYGNLVPRIKKTNANLTEEDLKEDPIYKLYLKLIEMKYRTTTSTWMIREVDKITSLWYFAIVMFTFIVALVFFPSLDDRLLATFLSSNETRVNNSDSMSDEGTDASEQAQEETLLGVLMRGETTIAATQNETTELSKNLVIHHIRAAIAATKTNDKQTALVEINAALKELNQLQGESEGNLVIRIVIIVISIVVLLLVLMMLYFRHKGLESMAGVTFKFFTEQAAIKKGKEYYDKDLEERFDKDLEDIMQYLNEGNWDLAGIGVTRIMDEYNDFIRKGVKKEEICESVNYQDLGIY